MSDEPRIVTINNTRVVTRPEGVVRSLGRATLAAFIATFVLALVASIAVPGPTLPSWIEVPVGLLMLLAIALFLLATVAQVWTWIAPSLRASVSASDRGLRVSNTFGGSFVERREIESAWVVRERDKLVVEVRKKNGNVVATHVGSEQEATDLLDVLGIAPDRRATSMQLGSPFVNASIVALSTIPSSCMASVVTLALVSQFALSDTTAGFLLFTLVGAAMPLALRLFAPPRVHVGNDGVSVGDGERQWFVSFADLAEARCWPGIVQLTLRNGTHKRIGCLGTDKARLEALVARISAGIANRHTSRALSDRLTLLDRNGRTIAEWEGALRTVLDEGHGYRAMGLTRAELLDVLGDPQALEERRIAATFVLSLQKHEAPAEQIRVAIDSTAQSRVRVALEHASEGRLDEESINAAASARVRVAE